MLSARLNAAEFAGDDDPLPVNFDFDRAPTDALESLDARKTGERISWNWRDTWEEQHREAFVVAKMAKADMLKEVHDSLHEAMENGTPYPEWRKKMEANLQDRWIGKTLGELWDELPEEEKQKRPRPEGAEAEKRIEASRLRTIYYTNSIVSSQAGQYKQLMKQAEDYPYWRYKTAGDSRVRESHRALHNKVFRYNDPFWETHYPPNGWFCRCSVEALDDYDLKHLEDKEIKVEDGGSHVSWKTRPNGDKVAVWQDGDQQVECAPGWSYNVGRPGYRQQVAEEKAKEYPAQLRKQIEAESAKEDQEQSERTKKLEEIAKQLEEQRKNRERPRVEVVRKPQPSETPLDLQRQFREEEKALIAQHRGQERFEAIASGDRKLMREMRRAEEDALAELREKQRQRLEAAQRQTQTVKPLEKMVGLDGAKGQPKAQANPEDQNQVEQPRQAEKPGANAQKILVRRLAQDEKISADALPKAAPYNELKGIYDGNIKYYDGAESQKTHEVGKTDNKDNNIKELPYNVGQFGELLRMSRQKMQQSDDDIYAGMTEKEVDIIQTSKWIMGKQGNASDREDLQRDVYSMLHHFTDSELNIFRLIATFSKNNNLFKDLASNQGGYDVINKNIQIDLRKRRYELYLTQNEKQDYNHDMLALCHESFHMLEYFTSPNKKPKKDNLTSFLALTTREGNKFHKAAMEDMSDYLKNSTGYSLKYIMSSKRSKAKIEAIQRKYANHLQNQYTTEKERFYASTMLDAIGMETKGLLSIESLVKQGFLVDIDGYYTHTGNYNVPENCNSEIWANMGGAKLRCVDNMTSSQKELFKRTTKIFNRYLRAIAHRI